MVSKVSPEHAGLGTSSPSFDLYARSYNIEHKFQINERSKCNRNTENLVIFKVKSIKYTKLHYGEYEIKTVCIEHGEVRRIEG